MTTVLLVRHAEPSIDIELPAAEWSLTERGIRSTNLLATELASFRPTVIIASPERKAIDTARLLSDSLGIPCEQEDRFSEHGADPGEFLADYGEFRALVKRHFDHPDQMIMRGESAHAAGLRFGDAIQSWLERSPAELPVIVSHGRILSSWLGSVSGTSAWEIWTELRMPDLIQVNLTARTYRSIDVPLF
jgi:broad specificity phosphatase PhoE